MGLLFYATDTKGTGKELWNLHQELAPKYTRALATPAQKAPAVHQAKKVSPEQVIPMDDDFKDF